MKSKRELLSEAKKCWSLRNQKVYQQCIKDIRENKFGIFSVNKNKYYNHWRKEFNAGSADMGLLIKAHKYDDILKFIKDVVNN